MNILFTAKQGFSYNRTLTLWNGLTALENVDVKKYDLKSKKHFEKNEFNLATENADFIYIPPFRHSDARFLWKKTSKPIVFDPLISKFLTKVVDYKHYWKAPQKYIVDKISLNSCNMLLADTEHHKEYFSRTFHIPLNKIFVLPIGVDTNIFKPLEKNISDKKFHVGFYGSFVPLQGSNKIIEAAALLKGEKDIVFDIIGDGYCYKKALNLIKKHHLENIKLYGKVPYEKLNELIAQFDVSLGIFGDSLKADLVIPNKVYHYAAIKKSIITKDTPAIHEIFSDNENILLTQNNPKAIAQKIMELKSNPSESEKMAKNAYHLIVKKYNHIEIAKKFTSILEQF